MATTTAPPSSASSGTHEDARPRTLACASAERPPSQARAPGAHARPRADARKSARWTLKEAPACDRPPSPAAASRRSSCATSARASLHHTHTSAQRAPEREGARSSTRAQRSAAPFAECHEPPRQRLPVTSAARRASEPAPHTHTSAHATGVAGHAREFRCLIWGLFKGYKACAAQQPRRRAGGEGEGRRSACHLDARAQRHPHTLICISFGLPRRGRCRPWRRAAAPARHWRARPPRGTPRSPAWARTICARARGRRRASMRGGRAPTLAGARRLGIMPMALGRSALACSPLPPRPRLSRLRTQHRAKATSWRCLTLSAPAIGMSRTRARGRGQCRAGSATPAARCCPHSSTRKS